MLNHNYYAYITTRSKDDEISLSRLSLFLYWFWDAWGSEFDGLPQSYNRLDIIDGSILFGVRLTDDLLLTSCTRPLFTGAGLPDCLTSVRERWYGCLACKSAFSEWVIDGLNKQNSLWLFISNATDQWVFSLNLRGTLGSQISFSTYLQVF